MMLVHVSVITLTRESNTKANKCLESTK